MTRHADPSDPGSEGQVWTSSDTWWLSVTGVCYMPLACSTCIIIYIQSLSMRCTWPERDSASAYVTQLLFAFVGTLRHTRILMAGPLASMFLCGNLLCVSNDQQNRKVGSSYNMKFSFLNNWFPWNYWYCIRFRSICLGKSLIYW